MESLLDGWKENKRYKEDDDIIPTGGLSHSEEILQVEEAGIENNTEGCEDQAPKMKLCFGHPPIHTYFSSKTIFDFDQEIKRLEREQRLEVRRRKELAWLTKREHWSRRKWILEIIEEKIIDPARAEGHEKVKRICEEIVDIGVDEMWKTLTARNILRAEKRMQRLRMAAKQKKDLMEELDRKKRLRRAEMLSLEHRLKGLQVTTEVVTTGECRKRKKDWFHVESKDKALKMVEDDNEARRLLPHCCTWGRLGVGDQEDVLKGSLLTPCFTCRDVMRSMLAGDGREEHD